MVDEYCPKLIFLFSFVRRVGMVISETLSHGMPVIAIERNGAENELMKAVVM